MNPSTAFHPITDGQTERMNQEIEKYLRVYVNYRQSDWAEWLALAEFTHNDKASSATSQSPFFTNTGYHPWKGIENRVETRNEDAGDFANKMKKIRDEAAAALEKTQKTMKKYYDAKRRDAPVFKVGDKVWVEGKDIKTDRPTKKFDDLRYGPYEILEKSGATSWKLKLPETDLSHPVYNEKLLTPYVEPPEGRKEKRPPPVIVSGEKEYEVEEILNHRKRGKGYQYRIKWKDYPLNERTWEPARNLTNAKRLLDQYRAEHNFKVLDAETLTEEEKTAWAAKLREKGLMPPKTEGRKEQTESLPVLKQGAWDYLIHRYKPKDESADYPERYLWDPITGRKNIIENFPGYGRYERDTSIEV